MFLEAQINCVVKFNIIWNNLKIQSISNIIGNVQYFSCFLEEGDRSR